MTDGGESTFDDRSDEVGVDAVDDQRWRIAPWLRDASIEAARELHALLDGFDRDIPAVLPDHTMEPSWTARQTAQKAADRITDGLHAEVIHQIQLVRLLQAIVLLIDTLPALPLASDDETVQAWDSMAWFQTLTRLLAEGIAALERTVTAQPDGTYRVRWRPEDRALIAGLSTHLAEMILSDDENIVRLFPPAYGNDAERSAGFDALARHELIASRQAAIDLVLLAMDKDVVTEDELLAVMRSINDLRLVLGTALDVTEDDEDHRRISAGPMAAQYRQYERLTYLLGQILNALY